MSTTTPDLSDFPMNGFHAHPEWRFTDPMNAALGSLTPPEVLQLSRIEIVLPLGCPFSLFIVTGFIPDDGGGHASLVISRELAHQLAELLDGGKVFEWRDPLASGRRADGPVSP